MKRILILLSLFFVFLSFYPTLFEIKEAKNLPKERAFELVHNYVFDYNFYLSRIREGQEGKWLVTEKYYNQPHSPSALQIVYLYLGKLGGLFGLNPPVIYHSARVFFGIILLLVIGKLVSQLFQSWWQIVAYLFIVTTGSWPILMKVGEGWRFGTYWGGWSVIDSLQRITFIPHVLIGQIFLVLFVMIFSNKSLKSLKWGMMGLMAGIIFPPMLVVVYTIFTILTLLEIIILGRSNLRGGSTSLAGWFHKLFLRIIFILFSFPALLYLQVMTRIQPWQALSIFDIQHRSILPYMEYAKALGPMLPLGIAGLILALLKSERKFFPFISWILALGFLFIVFEKVPQQSPTRFTQMLINVPLGVLTAYFFQYLFSLSSKIPLERKLGRGVKISLACLIIFIVLMGMGVMLSMIGWKTDEVRGKTAGTWKYPAGVQLVYPLKDFMDGINFLKNNTKTTDVVLAYEAAGNYIPAYAGNYVYLGHANTPDEDRKLNIAQKFFSGKMTSGEAQKFLTKENIKYIYFGPQEKELGSIDNLISIYSFITPVYNNSEVTIYK